MIYKEINKGYQCLCYKMLQWKTRGESDIYNDINEHVTLVQLMDKVGNVNHTVSLSGCWIYIYSY